MSKHHLPLLPQAVTLKGMHLNEQEPPCLFPQALPLKGEKYPIGKLPMNWELSPLSGERGISNLG